MDALSLPSIKSMMNIKVRLQPYIRTFIEVFSSVPDGICWSSPNPNHALEAHVALQVFLTTVQPCLPSLHLACTTDGRPFVFLHKYYYLLHFLYVYSHPVRLCTSGRRYIIGSESLLITR